MAKEDRDKKDFTCYARLYRFLRMPFGLMNAPATYQRVLDLLASGFKWKSCLVYLDVIFFSKSIGEHFNHVDEILLCLHKARVTLKLKKFISSQTLCITLDTRYVLDALKQMKQLLQYFAVSNILDIRQNISPSLVYAMSIDDLYHDTHIFLHH